MADNIKTRYSNKGIIEYFRDNYKKMIPYMLASAMLVGCGEEKTAKQIEAEYKAIRMILSPFNFRDTMEEIKIGGVMQMSADTAKKAPKNLQNAKNLGSIVAGN